MVVEHSLVTLIITTWLVLINGYVETIVDKV